MEIIKLCIFLTIWTSISTAAYLMVSESETYKESKFTKGAIIAAYCFGVIVNVTN